jgi:Flp pilus assembly protein TadD
MMHDSGSRTARTAGRSVCLFTAALMLSACSQTSDLLGPAALTAQTIPEQPPADATPQTELQKATAYWGGEYRKDPKKLENALSYARNLKALGEKAKAMNVLHEASAHNNNSRDLAGEYGRLALELDQLSVADKLLSRTGKSSLRAALFWRRKARTKKLFHFLSAHLRFRTISHLC